MQAVSYTINESTINIVIDRNALNAETLREITERLLRFMPHEFDDSHIPRASDEENAEITAALEAMSDDERKPAFTVMLEL
jgi:hypothetical protein